MGITLSSAQRDQIVRDASAKAGTILGSKMARLVARLGMARPDRKEEIPTFLQKLETGVYEQYTLQRLYSMVAASVYVDFTSSFVYPWSEGNGATSPAPANQLAIFDKISLVVQHDCSEALLAELLEELDVIIHFAAEGRRPLRTPASNMIQSWIHNPDAGNNSATAIAGTRPRHMRTGRVLQLDIDSPLVVMPQDTNPRIEFAWNKDYSANTAAAGSDATLALNVIFEGERLAV